MSCNLKTGVACQSAVDEMPGVLNKVLKIEKKTGKKGHLKTRVYGNLPEIKK